VKSGWEVKPLGEVCSIAPKKALAKQILTDDQLISFVPMDHLGQLRSDFAPKEDRKLSAAYKGYTYFADDDVIIAKITPCFENGKMGVAKGMTNGVGFGSSEFVPIRGRGRTLPQFLFYFLLRDDFRLDGARVMSGAVGHKRVPKEYLENLPIPLPPLEEQKRIVAVLDGALEGLDRARTHIQTNLQNARELFEAHLKSIFRNDALSWEADIENVSDTQRETSSVVAASNQVSKRNTKTGGRAAAEQHILGDFSLSVKIPSIPTRKGWKWSLLTDLARLESGHTPSRRKPEYWGGDIRWIGIKDARDRHGAEILETLENTNDLGIDNSSARVLPKGTVCLSRTASVGYITIMGRDMATSQDFVNWVCGPDLIPEFLKIILLAQGAEFFKFSSGAVHQTIYFPQAKGFAICHPRIETQREIIKQADDVLAESKALIAHYRTKLADLDDLRQSLLQKAFAGELT
jgi:type I restriction enzyme S subunit